MWAYLKLRDNGRPAPATIDWAGNVTFAAGLIAGALGHRLRHRAVRSHTMGWTNPTVLGDLIGGIVFLGPVSWIETKGAGSDVPDAAVQDPGVQRRELRRPARLARPRRTACSCSSSGCRGSGCRCTATASLRPRCGRASTCCRSPAGFLIAGPVSGYLSDHFGARPFATAGMIAAALSFALLAAFPSTSAIRHSPRCSCSTALAWACSPRRTGPGS